MKYLRACAVCGGAVVVLHHPAKTENSKGRGSSAIRAGCDLAFLHTLDKEAKVIKLRVDKNRHGERHDFTIKADFEEGRFELSEAAWLQHRHDEISHLQELISTAPGISSNQLAARAGGRKGRVLKLLEEGAGTLWIRQQGPRGSKIFFPTEGTGSWFPSKEGKPGERVAECPDVSGNSGNSWEPGTSEPYPDRPSIATSSLASSASAGAVDWNLGLRKDRTQPIVWTFPAPLGYVLGSCQL